MVLESFRKMWGSDLGRFDGGGKMDIGRGGIKRERSRRVNIE